MDILGRSSLNDLILRVAGGKGDLIECGAIEPAFLEDQLDHTKAAVVAMRRLLDPDPPPALAARSRSR